MNLGKKIRIFLGKKYPQNRSKIDVLGGDIYTVESGMVDLLGHLSTELQKLSGMPHSGHFNFFRRSYFCQFGASCLFWPFRAKTIFPASWTHLDRSGVAKSYRLLKKSQYYVHPILESWKIWSHFLKNVPFFFSPLFHGRYRQGNFFFPNFGWPLLTNRIPQKLPWSIPFQTDTK